MARFKRILLKLSGESLMGEQHYGIDEHRLAQYAEQIKEIHDMGVEIGIVIGGGNIFRGLKGAGKGFDQVKDIPTAYVVNDDTEIGIGNKIPLWLFGFLY